MDCGTLLRSTWWITGQRQTSMEKGNGMLKTYRVHKSRGTCKIVNVEATHVRFRGGVAMFYRGQTLVMAYAPWAWKSISEEEPSELPSPAVIVPM